VNNIERKKIWDRLSDEEKNLIEKERQNIIEWSIQEEEMAVKKIKEEGRYIGGLDGDYPELREISSQVKSKMNALMKKYGLNP
jgi:TRAP-type C4-dicarboxylate transport system substrate-binding protein